MSLPGNFDKLNCFAIFESNSKMGIPTIKKEDFVPDWLVPYRQRIRTDKDVGQGAVHTFIDDYRFEQLWHRPIDTLSVIKRVGGALSPDFSLFSNFPLVMQMWNVYRNRWVGCYWQSQGIKVIPTMVWTDERSFDFCFEGVEKGSYVAVSTVGSVRHPESRKIFERGYMEMLKRIEPELVLCYGESSPFNFEEYTRVKWYPSYWKGIREAMRGDKDGK